MAPDQCASLEDVRREIDRIDRDLIGLLALRAQYVDAAARFKTSEQNVAAPERQAAMMRVRREWAAGAGLDPDVIEDVYRRLIAYFVQRELRQWSR
jgi:isochorismate pyruvate lyase